MPCNPDKRPSTCFLSPICNNLVCHLTCTNLKMHCTQSVPDVARCFIHTHPWCFLGWMEERKINMSWKIKIKIKLTTSRVVSQDKQDITRRQQPDKCITQTEEYSKCRFHHRNITILCKFNTSLRLDKWHRNSLVSKCQNVTLCENGEPNNSTTCMNGKRYRETWLLSVGTKSRGDRKTVILLERRDLGSHRTCYFFLSCFSGSFLNHCFVLKILKWLNLIFHRFKCENYVTM